MEGERELLLCFGHAEVRKKRQRAIGEEGERYIYPQPPTVITPKGLGKTEPAALRSDEAEPATLGEMELATLRSGETEPETLGEMEPASLGSGEMEPAPKGSGEMEPATCLEVGRDGAHDLGVG